MGMTKTIFFPSDAALAAMGNTSKRWASHLEQGKIFIESELQAVSTSGPGRGRKRKISLEAVAQGAIALALIDAGTEVRQAYRIGAAFAYQGSITGQLLTDETSQLDPVLDRLPGKLFAEGQTLLVYAVGADHADGESLAIISDADPSLSSVGGFSQAAMLIDRVSGADGGARVVMNLSLLCAQIARDLEIDFDAAFGGTSKP